MYFWKTFRSVLAPGAILLGLAAAHPAMSHVVLGTMPVMEIAMPVMAQGQQQLYVKSLAATCANCHGTNGKAVEGSAVVSLAGVPKDYIIAQMVAFKSGARPATIMHQIGKGYSDAQVEQIATYFAAQKK